MAEADKTEKQIAKTGLPRGGTFPFRPQIEMDRRGRPIIKKYAVSHGPKKEKRGYVNTMGVSLIIGKDKKTPISLLRDDEYNDRFFLLVGPTEVLAVRFVITGADLAKLVEALQQVKEELEDLD